MSNQSTVLHLSQAKIAEALGVSQPTFCKWVAQGLPTSSVEAAKQWASVHKGRVGRRPDAPVEEIPLPAMSVDEVENAYQLIQRLRTCESRISSEIAGWTDHVLPRLSRERDAANGKERQEVERKIYVIGYKVSVLRGEQRNTISALIRCENEVLKLEKARGKLIDLDAAKDLVTRSILPLTIAIRRIPDSGRDNDEKARLQAISEALLAEIRRGTDEAIAERNTGG